MSTNQILDALLGVAVGDALGVPADWRQVLVRRDDIADLANRLTNRLS